jgi:hypothetical protein
VCLPVLPNAREPPRALRDHHTPRIDPGLGGFRPGGLPGYLMGGPGVIPAGWIARVPNGGPGELLRPGELMRGARGICPGDIPGVIPGHM